MSGTEWLVLLGGIAAIAWVNWYFFLSGRATATAAARGGADGVQEVTVVVQGGYEPREVRVRPGGPVRIVFDRRETSGCTEDVVFPDFGIRRFLPPERKTVVEITPPAPGSYEFTCGMGMFRGKVIVE
ncbi:MAG TPA: cupredoxin domain-containing protein [Gemmatimonadales bacterium]|jgi:plastocyanin domain-containing protein|nr:cupredoxin domain-containing protein [Gemmatimonadales bacterium]